MEKYIRNLIKEGEHHRLDFKFEVSDARKIARSLVAFANTDGGTLLVGVKDNGKIAGVRSEEEVYMVDAAASLYCRPQIKFTVRNWMVERKSVLEVSIPKGQSLPHMAQIDPHKWQAFVRVLDENIQATPIHLKVWEKSNKDQEIYFAYTREEKRILDLLEKETLVSFTRICRLAMISRLEAEELLSDMIRMGLIRMRYFDQRFQFEKV